MVANTYDRDLIRKSIFTYEIKYVWRLSHMLGNISHSGNILLGNISHRKYFLTWKFFPRNISPVRGLIKYIPKIFVDRYPTVVQGSIAEQESE